MSLVSVYDEMLKPSKKKEKKDESKITETKEARKCVLCDAEFTVIHTKDKKDDTLRCPKCESHVIREADRKVAKIQKELKKQMKESGKPEDKPESQDKPEEKKPKDDALCIVEKCDVKLPEGFKGIRCKKHHEENCRIGGFGQTPWPPDEAKKDDGDKPAPEPQRAEDKPEPQPVQTSTDAEAIGKLSEQVDRLTGMLEEVMKAKAEFEAEEAKADEAAKAEAAVLRNKQVQELEEKLASAEARAEAAENDLAKEAIKVERMSKRHKRTQRD